MKRLTLIGIGIAALTAGYVIHEAIGAYNEVYPKKGAAYKPFKPKNQKTFILDDEPKNMSQRILGVNLFI